MASHHSRDVLKRLWATGEWSDLRIVCEDSEWRVHKSVVCAGSSYFAEAYRLHTEKAYRCLSDEEENCDVNAIDIDEPEIVLVQVLRYLYGLDLNIGMDGPVVLARDVVDLYLNIEKYEIPGLATEVHRATVKEVEDMARHGEYYYLISFGMQLYRSKNKHVVPEAIFEELIRCTVKVLDDLIGDDAWDLVLCHKDYVTDIAAYLAKARSNIADQ